MLGSDHKKTRTMEIRSIVKVFALCVVMFSVTGCDPDRIARGLQTLDEAYGVNGKYTNPNSPDRSYNRRLGDADGRGRERGRGVWAEGRGEESEGRGLATGRGDASGRGSSFPR